MKARVFLTLALGTSVAFSQLIPLKELSSLPHYGNSKQNANEMMTTPNAFPPPSLVANNDWLAVEGGSITANNPATSLQDVTKGFIGLRISSDEMEIGVLRSNAGWFLDLEAYLREDFRLGDGSADALVVVGVPCALMGTHGISGWDVTLGLGLDVYHPVGPTALEVRAETLVNFASWIIHIDSSVDPRGAKAVLLLRLRAGFWFPLGNLTELHIGIRHDNFHYWRMTSGVLALAI